MLMDHLTRIIKSGNCFRSPLMLMCFFQRLGYTSSRENLEMEVWSNEKRKKESI